MARPAIGGIYAICNTVTGLAYLGCSVNIAYRWKCHRSRLERALHHNQALQEAWREQGSAVFTLVTIQRSPLTPSPLEVLEKQWCARARAAGIALYNDQVGQRRAA